MRKPSGSQCVGYLLGLIEFIDYIPGQQLFNAIDRMIGDALEHVLPIALRIDKVLLD